MDFAVALFGVGGIETKEEQKCGLKLGVWVKTVSVA